MTQPTTGIPIMRVWLLAVAALIYVMVLVGGATRLTESGLSIVEWQPVTGVVPPLSADAWQAEFEKYQTIPQFRDLNSGMTLAEFKTIYWWEWSHRLLGRLIGAAFLLPFLWFLWRGWVGPGLRWRLWAIFALGSVQGAVGWWMVASGLADRTSVSQYRLAFHLTLACVIFAAVLWTAQQLLPKRPWPVPQRIASFSLTLVVLVLAQIYLGALVAGLRAGMVYNTWPLIDGVFVPKWAALFFNEPWWVNIFENALTVQFNHRMMAYLLLVLAFVHAIDVARAIGPGQALFGAATLVAMIVLQAVLGIFALLQQAPIGLALVHQGVAMAVLTVAVLHAAQFARQKHAAAVARAQAGAS